MLKRFLLGAGLALFLTSAYAQSVQQSGSITPNTSPIWNSNGVIKGGNSAADSPLTTFGVTRDAVDALCVSSARKTAAGRNQLCLQAATSGPAKISLQNYGTATAQDLQFVINGTAVTIPTGGGSFLLNTGGQTTGHMPCFTSTTNVLQDCGVGVGAGTQFGVPYYSAGGTLSSTGAAGAGQFLLGQSASAPLWSALSGDVQTVSAGGALTLSKVNGIPFSTSYTAHGVLVAEGSSAFASVTTASVGQCLLSQGTSSDPIWSSCASGSGSAGGSNTQVQFNNATALGGSVNLTWVSPALTIGVAGTTTGQLALASSTATGTVTVQAPGVSGTYNFNMPTGAGSSGQALISGGGGATPNTFGTLGVFGGGTACSIASGTCLDNITGFGSTGFVFRSGAGTYTFANPIPVGNGGTGLANGTSGGVLAFTGSTTIASSGALTQFTLVVGGGAGATPSVISKGTAGQILLDQTGANPSWNTLSGDATINSAGALTIANSAVTVGKMANAAAYSLLGNFTGSSAAPQVSTIGALTQKASPAASDLVLIQDQAASGQLKYAQVSAIASAGSVASIDGATGAFTTNNGVTTSANAIGLTAARRTNPTTSVVTGSSHTGGFAANGSGTYTTPANVLWIEFTMVGGGGGGGGSGATAGAASNAVATCWKTSGAACTTPDYSAGGGNGGGANGNAGGAGGTISGASTCTWSIAGGSGGAGNGAIASSVGAVGGNGGSSFYTGAGGGGAINTAGITAASNSGSGGGGGGLASTVSQQGGGGGGAGGTCYTIISAPAGTYTYSVGTGTTGGTAGTSGKAGGDGAGGQIVVTEHYGS